MALAPKKVKVVKEVPMKCECNCSEKLSEAFKLIDGLIERVTALETKKAGKASIHKTETFNGEEATPLEQYSGAMRMTPEDKLISMRNAIAILPPNLMEDGKHTPGNIGAICGFIVTDEMYEELYEDAA